MTADAKVGLLLGLFFIVIIAFLVNDLPKYMREENTLPPDVSITTDKPDDMLVGRGFRRNGDHPLFPDNPRLPHLSPDEVDPPVNVPPAPEPQPEPTIIDGGGSDLSVVADVPKATIHEVKSGEILPVIAKLYYGPEEGNRRIVIQKLYEANASILKSPDDVHVGDKLTIPPLNKLLGASERVIQTPSPSERLRRNFPDTFDRVERENARAGSEYVVQRGDNLWSIAQQKLGNGSRYKEIVMLNKSRIDSPSDIPAGTRLIMPIQ